MDPDPDAYQNFMDSATLPEILIKIAETPLSADHCLTFVFINLQKSVLVGSSDVFKALFEGGYQVWSTSWTKYL